MIERGLHESVLDTATEGVPVETITGKIRAIVVRSTEHIEAEIRAEVAATKEAFTKAVAHAVRAGNLLIELKDQLPHGEFLSAVKRCLLSARTAQEYMRVARHAKVIETKCADVAHLTLRDALKLIAVARTPDDAEDPLPEYRPPIQIKEYEPEDEPEYSIYSDPPESLRPHLRRAWEEGTDAARQSYAKASMIECLAALVWNKQDEGGSRQRELERLPETPGTRRAPTS
jgi:hypothetical protein